MAETSVVEHGQSTGNPLLQMLPKRFRDPKKVKEGFDRWVAKQPLAVECAIATLTGSFQGGALGAVMGSIANPSQIEQAGAQAGQASELKKAMQGVQMGGPWVQARNFAVMTGVHAGIALAAKRIRKTDDAYTTMIAAFGSGISFSLVSGITQGNRYQGAFTTGVMFALFQGAFYKLSKKFSAPKIEPFEYARARHLLTSLGYPEYAKNVQKGRLNDHTIWLWNDSALQEVRIPPGPRLLILNHVDRYRSALKPPMFPPRQPPPQAAPHASPAQKH